MAIINTLQKCLEHKHLTLDSSAHLRINDLLEVSRNRNELIQKLVEKGSEEFENICSLAYESMFACLRCLVYKKGIRESNMRCLLLACEAYYVNEGLLERSILDTFTKAQSFHVDSKVASLAAQTLLRQTEAIVLSGVSLT